MTGLQGYRLPGFPEAVTWSCLRCGSHWEAYSRHDRCPHCESEQLTEGEQQVLKLSGAVSR